MPRRCQLTARAQIDGAIRDPGYIFTLGDDERGPHKAVRPVHPSIHSSHVAGHDHPPSEGADEPLFVELPDEEAAAEEPTASDEATAEGEVDQGPK